MIVNRDKYLQELVSSRHNGLVKIITGMRRCGKSFLLFRLFKRFLEDDGVMPDHIIEMAFDDYAFKEFRNPDKFYKYVKEKIADDQPYYILLDEVQMLDEFEDVLNGLLHIPNADVYVTGSNSRMMSSEISTYLTGRYVSFRIYPLSFSEYLDFRKSYTEVDDHYREFSRYVKMGGFPALQLQEYSLSSVYTAVRDIYNSTIFTDIVKRSQIRKVDQLERVVKYVFSNVGQTFSALTLSKYLKSQNRQMDPETVYSYLNKLESAYILHRCQRYDIKGKEILKTQEKFYLADPAFRFSVLGYDENAVASMLENIIYLELRHRGYDVYVGKLDTAEIDFVATRLNEKIYIQIAQRISSEETERREYGNMLSIADNYPKYVLRTDVFEGCNYEGIRTMHVADFLLSEEY